LRFHWRLPFGGERSGAARAAQADTPQVGLPDLAAQIDFCRRAEECGIDSVLVDFGFAKPDSILLAAALGMVTEKIRFIVAYRSGLSSPTTFVQQLNTLSALINGRFSLNIVAGSSPQEQRGYGDFLSHDERYARTQEFLNICRAFWTGRGEVDFLGKYYRIERGRLQTPFISSERRSPEIYIAGSSEPARRLALEEGSCWMRLADTPENLRQSFLTVLDRGIEVGLRLSLIAGHTRDEALGSARALLDQLNAQEREGAKERTYVQHSDSVSIRSTHQLAETEWLTPCLWTGAIRSYGPAAISLVGTPEEIADAIIEYKSIGVSQFIFSGWPKLDSMLFFGREILPRIRKKEDAPVTLNS
jgi:alkanesulfonate monooxygenase